MSKKIECHLPSGSTTYEIIIQSGILKDKNLLHQYLAPISSRFAIITDETTSTLYGDALRKTLSDCELEVYHFTFPNGEQHKTRATKESLENQMFEKGLGRDICILALGGGVVTDTAGYLAATYCRGVPLVMIPTSLLAMVDASIGGKTGVNVPNGKNLVGCIYQPKKVIIDPSTLKTLPAKEIKNGVVEMLKHGLIVDSNYFEWLVENSSRLLTLDPQTVEKAIFESCRIKLEIVEQDEKEAGKRRLVNFGHTIAHALESITHYGISHGEAVAIGLLVESYLAVQLGNLDPISLEKIRNALVGYGLPLKLPSRFPEETILAAMTLDKKSLGGKPRFVIIDKIGSARNFNSDYCTFVEESLIKKSLQWMQDDLCRN